MRSSLRRRASAGMAFAALGLGLTALSARPAAAQTTMVADDITPATGFAGQSVTGFSFTMGNLNSVAVSVAPTIYFYDSSGSGGGPGTLLGGITFNPISMTAGSVGLYTYNPGTAMFALPSAGGFFWAGMSYGSTTATTAQLNQIGQGIFGAPTVGSSQDVAFQSTSPVSPTTVTSNPAGGLFNFGGSPNPPANFGLKFLVGTNIVYNDTAAYSGFVLPNGGAVPPSVPEASTTVSLGLLLALGMGGLIVASKRKKASVQA